MDKWTDNMGESLSPPAEKVIWGFHISCYLFPSAKKHKATVNMKSRRGFLSREGAVHGQASKQILL